jgi:general secretion pathway protein G
MSRFDERDKAIKLFSKRSKGFTLIEVLLVVIILGLIAAMVVPRLAGRSKKARISIARTDIMASIPSALDLYELDTGDYPTTEQGLQALVAEPTFEPIPRKWSGPYLKKAPTDPWDNPYQYRRPSSHQGLDFDLYSFGPDGQDGGNDDITNWDLTDETSQ